jgi:hypothetical protein
MTHLSPFGHKPLLTTNIFTFPFIIIHNFTYVETLIAMMGVIYLLHVDSKWYELGVSKSNHMAKRRGLEKIDAIEKCIEARSNVQQLSKHEFAKFESLCILERETGEVLHVNNLCHVNSWW